MKAKNKDNRSMEQIIKEKEQHEVEKAPGYGDKKLEGPNRPSE